jgi:RNA recognition motif-containing protein
MNIYVGNLARETDEQELKKVFEEYGEVSSVSIIKDRLTGMPRGFAFVEMPKEEEGNKAVEALNGKQIGGRTIKVDKARPRTDDRRRFSPRR